MDTKQWEETESLFAKAKEERRRILETHNFDSALKQIFLGYSDTLTVLHIKLLEILSDPYKAWKENNPQPKEDDLHLLTPKFVKLREDIIEFFPELKKSNVVEIILEDLKQKGLLEKENSFLNGYGIQVADLKRCNCDSQDVFRLVTDLGKEFIKFIQNPNS